MKKDIEVLLKNIRIEFEKIDFYNIKEELLYDYSIKIKHILEDLRSVLDYTAVYINEFYQTNNENKIYFPYVTKKNIKTFDSKFEKNFPGIKMINIELYNVIKDVQIMNNQKWLVTLMELVNNIKHVELKVNKIIEEKHTNIKNQNSSLSIVGNIECSKIKDNQYGIFGEGQIYASENGQINIYSNGMIQVGNGIYDIDDKKQYNINVERYTINKLYFVEDDQNDVENILITIIQRIQELINKIDKCMI